MGAFSDFAQKNKAKTKKRVGQARLNMAKSDVTPVLGKMSNKDRLALTRDGAKNLIEGTQELNRLKRNQRAEDS